MLFLMTGRVCAMETDEIVEAQADAIGLDTLQQAAEEYVPDIDWTENINLEDGLSKLLETGTDALNGVLKKAVRSGVLLLIIVLLTGLADSSSALGSEKTIRAVPIAAVLAITAVSVTDVNTLIGLGREVIENMELFSKVLLPTITTAIAASGSPGGAAARQLAVMLFSDVLVSLINRLLLPLVYVYIAACTACAAVGNEGLKRIASTLKWVITSILTAVLLAFVGYLSISGAIAGTTDAVTIKAAKFTMSNMVPVVGGILSDAAETVLAGAGILKNTVGVIGMLVVIGMCLLPFMQLGIHYLVYKITATLAATVSDSRITNLIDGIGGAFGMILGMAGACATVLLISMVSAITLVNS